jgi:hypothetical protein
VVKRRDISFSNSGENAARGSVGNGCTIGPSSTDRSAAASANDPSDARVPVAIARARILSAVPASPPSGFMARAARSRSLRLSAARVFTHAVTGCASHARAARQRPSTRPVTAAGPRSRMSRDTRESRATNACGGRAERPTETACPHSGHRSPAMPRRSCPHRAQWPARRLLQRAITAAAARQSADSSAAALRKSTAVKSELRTWSAIVRISSHRHHTRMARALHCLASVGSIVYGKLSLPRRRAALLHEFWSTFP